MRRTLADRYIQGSGIEIGAGHSPWPLPPGVQVTYVDKWAQPELEKLWKDVKVMDLRHVVDDAETLSTFDGPGDQDFVITSHVLEHCENVIGAIHTWLSVLKPGGVILCAVPEKNGTFDRDRPVTPFGHLVADYVHGPEHSAAAHYREWHTIVDKLAGQELEDRIAQDLESEANIHFHCWDIPAQHEMFRHLSHLGYTVLEQHVNGAEMIWALRKNS